MFLLAVEQGLKYAKSHEWAKIDGDTATVGISDFAQVAKSLEADQAVEYDQAWALQILKGLFSGLCLTDAWLQAKMHYDVFCTYLDMTKSCPAVAFGIGSRNVLVIL